MESGLYEQLISHRLDQQLNELGAEYIVNRDKELPSDEAPRFLSGHVRSLLEKKLLQIRLSGENGEDAQLALCNKIISLLESEESQKISRQLLRSVYRHSEFTHSNPSEQIKNMTPFTRLSHGELFTGSAIGRSLDQELAREILSADEICWIVSFVKWTGLRILLPHLKEFTSKGKKLRLITTTYMQATDLKAVRELSKLSSTEIKISYNSDHERLHAKAYLFKRNSGFTTAYCNAPRNLGQRLG